MPYQRLADKILLDWRAAERDLATVAAEAAEAGRLQAEIERLRREYQALLDEAERKQQLDLPPSPDLEGVTTGG